MPDTRSPDPEFDAAVAECRRALHHGRVPDAVVERRPDLIHRLREYLTAEEQLAWLRGPAGDLFDGDLNRTIPAPGTPVYGSVGPQTGDTVGNYTLLEPLGRGSFAEVFRARDLRDRRIVALKLMRSHPYGGAGAIQVYRLLAEFEHPNIAQIYEVGEHDGRHFVAMEYCDGDSLANRIAPYRGGGPVPPAEAARIVATIADAVQAAHDRDLIHRDLKPHNILLTADGRLKLVDFGPAPSADPDDDMEVGPVMGTPAYISPEQWQGRASASSDIFSLGVILYQLIVGHVPFRGGSIVETVMKTIRDQPVPPRQLNPNVPPALEFVCLRCLEKVPERRYPSARELADDLGRFLRNEPVAAAPPVGFLGRIWGRLRGR